jgi:hypothetical protein
MLCLALLIGLYVLQWRCLNFVDIFSNLLKALLNCTLVPAFTKPFSEETFLQSLSNLSPFSYVCDL